MAAPQQDTAMARRGMQFGIFLAPFHRRGDNPTLALAARPRADRASRPARLRRGLDRRAPLRRLGDHRLAGADHRRGSRAHPAHPARHRGHQPALSPPVPGGAALRAARPHDARPGHAGLRAGRAGLGRLHARHRGRHRSGRAWTRRSRRSSPCCAATSRSPARPTGSRCTTPACTCGPTATRISRSPSRAR